MKLPGPCAKCAPFGGLWIETAAGLYRRCNCARGLALTGKDKPAEYRDPVLPAETLTMVVEMMSEVPFFPAEDGRRSVIAREIGAMCETQEQAVWLAMRMVRLYRKWPGVPEMRLVFCQSNQPLDAIEPIGDSVVYPDGIPTESSGVSSLKLIGKAAPGEISAAASIEDTVRDLAELKDMNRVGPPNRVREIPIKQLKPENMITQEMMQQAEVEYREQKARQELELAALNTGPVETVRKELETDDGSTEGL